MKKIAAVLSVCILLCAAFSVACAEDAEYIKKSTSFFGTFDTIVTVMGYVKEEATFETITARVQEQFEHYHRIFDAYNEYEGLANLYVLNRDAATAPVKVEPDLMALLLYCRDRQAQTDNTINIALGAVLSVWHEYREAGEYDPSKAEIPPMDTLREAANHTNFDDVIIDEDAGTVFFADAKLKLDIGAVAKGYAAEQVAQWLLGSEMPSFLISAGGNIRAGEPPLDGRQRWGISIQDPNESMFGKPGENELDRLFFANLSAVTSGDYQRFYVVDGVRYHHIISPMTLMPSDHFRSVTVVCEDSGWADMLSTALFIMPYEEGRAFAEAIDGVEVYWMLNDEAGTIEMTGGMEAMAMSHGAGSRD